MCELMGMSFAKPISADFSIRQFGQRGEENADGWGLAWYPDRSVAVVKEPIRWGATKYPAFLESYAGLQSSTYIAHVRHKTIGGRPTHADTHPFTREVNGIAYCLAHNGTLAPGVWDLPLGRFHPMGTTDSEWFFCHLLDQMATSGVDLSQEEGFAWLHARLTDLNRLGHLNCILSDGRRLFCYHDRAGYKGLTRRKIHIWHHEVRHLEDYDLHIDIEGDALNQGFVVATRALSHKGWQRFTPGELAVMEEGHIKYAIGHRRPQPVLQVPGEKAESRQMESLGSERSL